MKDRQIILNQETVSLQKDWIFLEPFRLSLEKVKDRSTVFICAFPNAGSLKQAYIKVYANRKHPFQRYLRQAKSWTEARNLLFFKSIGIPTPNVLAWGEQRNRIGRVIQEFIITEAVPDALQLDQFIAAHYPEANCPVRLKIAEQLGQWTRAMHDADFVHEDLKWRNILARQQGDITELFWIDCPKGYFAHGKAALRRKKLKDCATLDKIARIECSKEERQTFIRSYLGADASDEKIRKMCQDVEAYRKNRFDKKDNLQNKYAKQ